MVTKLPYGPGITPCRVCGLGSLFFALLLAGCAHVKERRPAEEAVPPMPPVFPPGLRVLEGSPTPAGGSNQPPVADIEMRPVAGQFGPASTTLTKPVPVSLRVEGTNIVLQFNIEAQKVYEVQTLFDLRATEWLACVSFKAVVTSQNTVWHPIYLEDPFRFFRVMTE